MKRLTSITGRNFKGLSFTTPLSPATILVGSNFSGKTARTDAIRLLLLGHLPELGKNNKDSMGLASGREMAVEGTFEDGATMSRAYRMKGDSVAQEKNVPQALDACEQLAVMLNAESYFAMSDRARVEYVAANCPSEGMITKEAVAERMKNVCKVATILSSIMGVGLFKPQLSIQDHVEMMIASATEQAKTARAYAGKMEGTVQGLAALRAGDDQTKIAAGLIQLDASRGAINAEMRGLDHRMATLKAEQEQRDKIARRHEVIAREFALVDVDGKRARLAELKDQVAKIVVPVGPDLAETAQLRRDEMRINAELAAARTNYTHFQSLHAVKTKELAMIDDMTTCPYCGACGDGWKTKKRDETNAAIANEAETMEFMKQTGLALKEQLTEVQLKIKTQLDAELARVTSANQAGIIQCEINAIEVALSRMNAMAEERASLPPAVAADPTELVEVGHKLSALQSQLNDIETQRRAAMGRQHELGRLAQAEEERDKAKAEAEAAKAAADELRVIQGEMVEAAFKPLLERANRIFGGVLRSPLAYRDGEIGTWRDGLWVGHRTFSGTERALTYAAIQAALTSASPVRIMLIDELGRLDTKNKRAVGVAACQAVERGDIDQFIGIDAEPELASQEIDVGCGDLKLTIVAL